MTDEHTRMLDTEVPDLLGPTIRRSTPLPHDKVADGVLKGTLAQGVVAPGHADRSRPEASDTSEAIYILGHSQAETRRLINQGAILGSTTERLLRSAGIEHGMRVLDVGCGAGDVSMLAGKLVGASGSVVGIDPNAQILTVARARARADESLHVTFIEASIGTFSDPRPFDLVVARYVLIHQADPVAFLRAAARFARPRGILALHELLLDAQVRSRPPVALWQQTVDWILTTFRAGPPSWDAAGRLIEHFSNAGLPQPTLFSETLVGGGADAPHYAWFAEVIRTLLPQPAYLQLTVPSFEFPRDVPPSVHFIGALPIIPNQAPLPSWAHELDGSRKVVLVTQGTVANHDFGLLIAPTLAALANEPDLLVVVTAGGRPIDAIPDPIPSNARVASYLPFEWAFPSYAGNRLNSARRW